MISKQGERKIRECVEKLLLGAKEQIEIFNSILFIAKSPEYRRMIQQKFSSRLPGIPAKSKTRKQSFKIIECPLEAELSLSILSRSRIRRLLKIITTLREEKICP